MPLLNNRYVRLLNSLINELENAKTILNNVKKSGNFSDSKELIKIYEELFSNDLIAKHIEFKIALVGKSTHSLFTTELTEANSNKHLTINLYSNEAIEFDQLYENRISDLLKFFKHLFSAIENFSIYQNKKKLEKFDALIDEIKIDVKNFIDTNIEADKTQPLLLKKLQRKETKDLELIKKGVQKKSNWQLFVNVILENELQYLYHFTDISNLNSIKDSSGLYSWSFCEKNNIKINTPGGNSVSRDLDKRKGAENYVRLSFCKNHPMEYFAKKENRITNPVKLQCDTELIYHIGTKFCNMNATKNEAIISDSFEYFKKIDFKICNKKYYNLNQIEKSRYQSEVLVFEHVPIKFILNINEL